MSAPAHVRTATPEPCLPVRYAANDAESIKEAAERSAARILAEAEADARRYIAEYRRRVDKMVDEDSRAAAALVEQATKVKVQYDRLMTAVGSALGREAGNGSHWPRVEPGPPPPEPERTEAPPGDLPDRLPASRPTTSGGFRPRASSSDTAAARALAAQMAAAGADRAAIANHLRDQWGIRDPGVFFEQLGL